MCGIVGVISAYRNGFSKQEQDIFRDMLFLDTLRGWDSTGVFAVLNNGNVHIRKEAVHGANFIKTDGYKEIKDKVWHNGQFLVGHNRAATRGTVNDKNAHPFWVDDKIVLVQNGTYHGSHKHHKDVEVDTEAIAHVIAENDSIATALQSINAAYALVWYNVEEKKLHIIRNNARPMAIAHTTDGTVVFASEIATIMYATYRAGTKLKGPPVEIPAGELHSFELQAQGWEETITKIDYNFRHTTHGNTQYIPAEEDDDSKYSMWSHRGQQGTRNYNHDVSTPVRTEKTLYNYVNAGAFLDWGVTRDTATEMMKIDQDTRGRVIPVEFVDYHPVYPSDAACKTWYIVGKILGREDNTPVVYLRVHDLTETEVFEFVNHALYRVAVCQGPVLHHVPGSLSLKNEDYLLLTMFCHKPEPIELLTNEIETKETKETEHVH